MDCFSCLGRRRNASDAAQQPLLPKYEHDTAREERLHEKLHTYQMFRAISMGSMPSNEQLIINLRSLLASDILNPDDSSVTDAGRLLTKHLRELLHQTIDLLLHKNSDDYLQDFIWCTTRSRISLDASDLSNRVSKARSEAKTAAAYQSVQTVGSMILNNSDFRLFLSDLQSIGRDVFRDSALTTSRVAENIGHSVGVSEENQQQTLSQVGESDSVPTKQDLANDVGHAVENVQGGIAQIAGEARQSTREHLAGNERQILLQRIQAAVARLRQKPDYNDSVSTLTLLLQRYASTLGNAFKKTVDTIEDDVSINKDLDLAVRNFGSLLKTFGDSNEWEALQRSAERVYQHQEKSPQFEDTVRETVSTIQKMFTDPTFYDNPEQEISRFQSTTQDSDPTSSLQQDVQALLRQLHRTWQSALQDTDVLEMINITHKILQILSPGTTLINKDLIQDFFNIFAPLLINAIQYLPIPRLEVSVPELDLLLENVIIEPGKTINNSSFLPFKFRVQTYNDVSLRKTLTGTVSRKVSLATIRVEGLSLRADDLGYWLRMHSGIFRFIDEGLASFHLDERGIDIHLDVEIGKDRLEQVLSLRAVRVYIHKLSYKLQRSRFSILSFCLKPVFTRILRKSLERQIARSIKDFFHAANRELVFMRERLRATRIAAPDDLITFVKAVAARLKPEDDPDLYLRLGLRQPGFGTFKGVYTPGSLVKLWEEEGRRAAERVEDFERGGWRNQIFDLKTTVPQALTA